MSLFTNSKTSKDSKDPLAKKSQFYVEFLGWMECRGLRGQRYTDPVIKELRRRQKKMDRPPKLTIQVSRKELKISQDVEEKKKRNIKKIKFPTIPARDVTYVHQASRPGESKADDIVACIYLGYMPRTQRFVHVHVYRFDEATTASTFARQMAALVESNQSHIREVEIDLANRGEIEDPRLTSSDGMSEPHTTDSVVGSASSAYSDEESPTFSSDDIDPDIQSLHEVTPFDNVADELKFRLQMKDAPILLPPKDYDTISRAHGNLENVNRRRCLNFTIVGDAAGMSAGRDRNGSSESGVDLTSPMSDTPSQFPSATAAPASPALYRPQGVQQQYPVSHQHQVLPFPDFADAGPEGNNTGTSSVSRGSHHSSGSRSISPEAPPLVDTVYPPKTKTMSPPMSPSTGRPYPAQWGPRGAHLSRQNSQSSYNSDGSRISQHSDVLDPPARNGIIYYKGGSSNDTYALPGKGKYVNGLVSPSEDIPPADYLDDDDDQVQMRDAAGQHRQHLLTQSMPSALIRSEMTIGQFRLSGDPRPLRRSTDSPTFVGGHNPYANAGMYSPKMDRSSNGSKR